MRYGALSPYVRVHELLASGSDPEFIPPKGNVGAAGIKYWTRIGRDRRLLAELNLSSGKLTFSRSTIDRTRAAAVDFLDFPPDERPSKRGNTIRVPPVGPRHEALLMVIERTLATLS